MTRLALLVVATAGFATEWVQRYNGPGNGNDGVRAAALSPTGYLYATGYAAGPDASRGSGETILNYRSSICGQDNQGLSTGNGVNSSKLQTGGAAVEQEVRQRAWLTWFC